MRFIISSSIPLISSYIGKSSFIVSVFEENSVQGERHINTTRLDKKQIELRSRSSIMKKQTSLGCPFPNEAVFTTVAVLHYRFGRRQQTLSLSLSPFLVFSTSFLFFMVPLSFTCSTRTSQTFVFIFTEQREERSPVESNNNG